uniref:Uncharacterized protein n=1 Tax=Tetranychus urticae TaxID=32264 RepID=T1L195_TETUR
MIDIGKPKELIYEKNTRTPIEILARLPARGRKFMRFIQFGNIGLDWKYP